MALCLTRLKNSRAFSPLSNPETSSRWWFSFHVILYWNEIEPILRVVGWQRELRNERGRRTERPGNNFMFDSVDVAQSYRSPGRSMGSEPSPDPFEHPSGARRESRSTARSLNRDH